MRMRMKMNGMDEGRRMDKGGNGWISFVQEQVVVEEEIVEDKSRYVPQSGPDPKCAWWRAWYTR